MKYKYEEGNLNISLEEELDMKSCKVLRSLIDGYIMRYQPTEFVIDLSNVKFMDSSGIGLLMGRYNLIKLMNSNMTIVNPSNSIKKILEISNINRNIVMRSE
jgi:stage II sporulation protein AA (anti-sigma F factor antagonist)